MADKEVHVTGDGGGGAGLGMIAGILLAAVAAILLIFFIGDFDGGNKTVDVNVQPPKIDSPAGGRGAG
jgi:hypothetical protein